VSTSRRFDDVEDVATGLCSTCPHRGVRGRFLIGRVRSPRERPRAAAPTMAAAGKGKGRRGDYQETLADASSPRTSRVGKWYRDVRGRPL
jgi:hypothetical protein